MRQDLRFSSKSPLLFLVPKQFNPFCFAFPSCGFFKKQHVFIQHIILFRFTQQLCLENWIMAVRYISIFWCITSLLLKDNRDAFFPLGAQFSTALSHVITSPILLTCYLCAACVPVYGLKKMLVYRTHSMPYSSPEVKCVEIKRLCLNLISEKTEDRGLNSLILDPYKRP